MTSARRLHRAAIEGDLAEARRALDAGADPDGPVDGQVALSWAVYHRHRRVAELLLDRGADPNRGRGFPAAGGPLHAAASRGGAGLVRLLVARGAKPDGKGDRGLRPLQVAVRHARDKVAVIRALLEAGADPNLTDGEGRSALSDAISERQPAALALMLGGKGDANGARSRRGWSHLHHAAAVGDAQIVELLLGSGGQLEASDARGWTPLHAAARFNSAAAARVLLARGADASAKTNGDETPSEIAQANATDAVLRVLARHRRGGEKRPATRARARPPRA